MCDQQLITCKDCLYVEACFALNSEMRKHRKDFLESDLCAKQCTNFKNRADYMRRKEVSTCLRNIAQMFGPFNQPQLDLLKVINLALDRCKISACTDGQLLADTGNNAASASDTCTLRSMTQRELLDKVMHSLPQFGWDIEYPTLFGKYGKTTSGLLREWVWYTSESITHADRALGKRPLTDASVQELLEMLAVEEGYWSKYYQDRCQVVEAKAQKLDQFVGTCEKKYFGYDETYSENSIDRVLEFLYAVLARDYYERK